MTVDKKIAQEIEEIMQLLGIRTEDLKKSTSSCQLAKALNSLLDIYYILKVDVSHKFAVDQIRQAININRTSFVKATLPFVLSHKLNQPTADFVAEEYIKCKAITSDDLLTEVQKPKYKQNRDAIWAIVLRNLELKPTALVHKIASLYEEPDSKGKYSKKATDQALQFMKSAMPDEYKAWDKQYNSPAKKFFRAVGGLFKCSSKKAKDDSKASEEKGTKS